jgi:hypothetical protein
VQAAPSFVAAPASWPAPTGYWQYWPASAGQSVESKHDAPGATHAPKLQRSPFAQQVEPHDCADGQHSPVAVQTPPPSPQTCPSLQALLEVSGVASERRLCTSLETDTSCAPASFVVAS